MIKVGFGKQGETPSRTRHCNAVMPVKSDTTQLKLLSRLKRFMLEQISPKAITLALFSALSLSQVALAQDVKTTESEDEIIFTANRYATSANEIGSQSIVITGKEIQNRQYHTATEALAHQPGVILSQNGINGPSSLFIRGSDRTLVLIDGVPMYDPIGTGGSFNFMSFGALLDVDRIEILNGPQSALYGSSGMAGVIQIFTNDLNQKGTKVRLMAGSNSTFQTSIKTTGQQGKLRYSLSGLIENSHGIDATEDKSWKQPLDYDKDKYKNRQLSGRLNYLLTEDLDIDFSYNYNNQYYRYDTVDTINKNVDNKGKLFSGRLALNGTFFDDKLTSSLSYSLMNLKREDNGSWSSDSFTGRTQSVALDNSFTLDQNFITSFGLKYMHERGKVSSASLDRTQNTKSIYLEQGLNFSEKFFNTIGIRYDKNSVFGSKTTYRLTSRYNLNDSLAFKGSLGTGFTTPTISQLYHFAWGGNSNLKSETSRGYDFGVEFKPTASSIVSISYFNTRYKDMIAGDPVTYLYENLDRVKTSGFEFIGSLKLNEQLELSGSYTYLDAQQKKSDQKYQKLTYRPRHQVTANLTYQPIHNLTLNASAIYYSERKANSYNPVTWVSSPVTLKSFLVFDVAGSYKINNTFEVDAKIQNLFNEDYNLIEGYRERGRSAYIGVNISL